LKGERFSVEAAFIERDLSREVGGVRFAAPVEMRNEWSHVRIKSKVSGAMLEDKLCCGVPVEKEVQGGRYEVKTINKWMFYADYKLEEEFRMYKNRAMVFGRSNRNANGEYTNIGKSGEAIRTGAGLYEQMDVTNTIYYNDFSLRLIEDALSAISEGKLNFDERVFVLRTGEHGATQLHKAILRETAGWTPLTLDNSSVNMVQKVSSPLHQNALSAGFQFTEFRAPNGVTIKIEVDPYYDDPERNKIKHPLGGFAFSYRYDIMNIGPSEQPNICKCQIKGKPEFRGYQWGMRNPWTGATFNMNMSYDEDSAVFHKMATLGVIVFDPTKTFSIIPNILTGNMR